VTVNVTPEMIAQFEAKRKADLAEQQRLDADYKAWFKQKNSAPKHTGKANETANPTQPNT